MYTVTPSKWHCTPPYHNVSRGSGYLAMPLHILTYCVIQAEHKLNCGYQLQILAPKDKDEAAESFKDDLTLTVREGQPLVLTPSQVKNMTLDDMVSIWKVSRQRSLFHACHRAAAPGCTRTEPPPLLTAKRFCRSMSMNWLKVWLILTRTLKMSLQLRRSGAFVMKRYANLSSPHLQHHAALCSLNHTASTSRLLQVAPPVKPAYQHNQCFCFPLPCRPQQ